MGSNVSELLEFLDKIANKGEIPIATAHARKIACESVIALIAEDEPHTVEWLGENIDLLANRLANKNNRLSTQSAATYKSRVQSALADFWSWRKNPLAWRPKARQRKTSDGRKTDAEKRNTSKEAEQPRVDGDATNTAYHPAYFYPLRPGLKVEVKNLPHDLTIEEVWRLACFVATLAEDFRPSGGSPFGELVRRN